MTTALPGEPSPRALGESLAALAVQVADLRGQVRAINARLDQAGLSAGVNLAARFEELAGTVADTLDAAAQTTTLSAPVHPLLTVCAVSRIIILLSMIVSPTIMEWYPGGWIPF